MRREWLILLAPLGLAILGIWGFAQVPVIPPPPPVGDLPQSPPPPPQVADPSLSGLPIPNGTPGAFTLDDVDAPGPGLYFLLGTVGLRRSHLRSAPLALLDQGTIITTTQTLDTTITCREGQGRGGGENKQVPATINATFQTAVYGDGPNVNYQSTPETFGNFKDAKFFPIYGMSAALGVRDGMHGMELSGYVIPAQTATYRFFPSNAAPNNVNVLSINSITINGVCNNPAAEDINQGVVSAVQNLFPSQFNRLNLPFFNIPAGFGGNQGLFQQANAVTFTLQQAMADAQLNYRYWFWGEDGAQLFLGARYVGLQEKFGYLVEDDTTPEPGTNVALYQVHTQNHAIVGQIGCEWDVRLKPWLGFAAKAQAGWGENFSHTNVFFGRGDGVVGFTGSRNNQGFCQVYETGLFLDIYPVSYGRLRAGWTALWLTGMTLAADQLDYDLSHTTGQVNTNGNAFYNGPVIQLQFVF